MWEYRRIYKVTEVDWWGGSWRDQSNGIKRRETRGMNLDKFWAHSTLQKEKSSLGSSPSRRNLAARELKEVRFTFRNLQLSTSSLMSRALVVKTYLPICLPLMKLWKLPLFHFYTHTKGIKWKHLGLFKFYYNILIHWGLPSPVIFTSTAIISNFSVQLQSDFLNSAYRNHLMNFWTTLLSRSYPQRLWLNYLGPIHGYLRAL